MLDPECPLALSDSQRDQANVPKEAATVARFRLLGTAHKEIAGVSLTFGGFAYRDKHGAIISVNVLTPLKIERGVATITGSDDTSTDAWRKRHMLQFGPVETLSEQEAADIPATRWDSILSVHRQYQAGARQVAWVMAYERLQGRMVSTGGGFAYAMQTSAGVSTSSSRCLPSSGSDARATGSVAGRQGGATSVMTHTRG